MNLLHFYLLLMNSLQFLLFKNWILGIFYPLRVNSWQFLSTRVNFLQFSLFKGECFAIFTLQAWILWIFHPSRVIFCIFVLLGMNFGNFHRWGWILCNFFSLRWILCNFYPLRLNSLQFLPFKGEIFASFTFLRFFWGERTKNYSCNGEFFEILIFSLFEVEFFAFFHP